MAECRKHNIIKFGWNCSTFQSRSETIEKAGDKFLREPKKARALSNTSYAFAFPGLPKFLGSSDAGHLRYTAADPQASPLGPAWHGAIKERLWGVGRRCPLADADPDPISPPGSLISVRLSDSRGWKFCQKKRFSSTSHYCVKSGNIVLTLFLMSLIPSCLEIVRHNENRFQRMHQWEQTSKRGNRKKTPNNEIFSISCKRQCWTFCHISRSLSGNTMSCLRRGETRLTQFFTKLTWFAR